MTLAINAKTSVIDCNTNVAHSSVVNTEAQTLRMTVQSQYVVQMTCYDYMSKITNTPIKFASGTRFQAMIGIQSYQSNALVTVSNAFFNDSDDWADVDPSAGLICFKVSLNVPALLTDLSGVANKTYCMQVWAVDADTNLPWIVSSQEVIISNVVVEI